MEYYTGVKHSKQCMSSNTDAYYNHSAGKEKIQNTMTFLHMTIYFN